MEQTPRTRFKKFLILCALCMTALFAAMTNAYLAPFYPQEAENKGATATEYGAVFGVFAFATVISSPIFGKYLFMLGMKITLYGGFFVAGISVFAFGLLDLVDDHDLFISLCSAVRFIQAVGTAAATTACFSITATVFPGGIATFFATVEIFTGLGFIIGPIVGGYLFELGGFQMPYMVIGPLMLLAGVFAHCVLNDLEGIKTHSKGNAFSVLSKPSVALDMASVTSVALGFGYLLPTLEPHLRQFNLTPVNTGYVFICPAVTYLVTASIIGWLCNKYVDPRKMVSLGHVFATMAFISVGPAEYIPMEPTVWMVCIGLALQGLGFSCIYVPAFTASLRAAVKSGLPDDVSTFGVVNSLVLSSFSLGTFVGPIIGGYLLDQYGFRRATLAMVIIHVVVLILRCLFVCVSLCSAQSFIGFVSSTRGCGGEADTLSLTYHQDAEDRSLTEDITQASTYGSTKESAVTFFKRYSNIDQHRDGSVTIGYSDIGQQKPTTDYTDDHMKNKDTTVQYITSARSGDTTRRRESGVEFTKELENIDKIREEMNTNAILHNVATKCPGGEIVPDKLLTLMKDLGNSEKQEVTVPNSKRVSFILHNAPIVSEEIMTGHIDHHEDGSTIENISDVLHDTTPMSMIDNIVQDKVVTVMGGVDNIEKHQGGITTKTFSSVLRNTPVLKDHITRQLTDTTLTEGSNICEQGCDITTEHGTGGNVSQDHLVKAGSSGQHQEGIIIRQIYSELHKSPVFSEHLIGGRETDVEWTKESGNSEQHGVDIISGHDASSTGVGGNIIQDNVVALIEGSSGQHRKDITVTTEVHNAPITRKEIVTERQTGVTLIRGSDNSEQLRSDIATGDVGSLLHGAAALCLGENIVQDEVVSDKEGRCHTGHQEGVATRLFSSVLHNAPVISEAFTSGGQTSGAMIQGSGKSAQQRGGSTTGAARALLHDAVSMGVGGSLVQDKVVTVLRGLDNTGQHHEDIITTHDTSVQQDALEISGNDDRGSQNELTMMTGYNNSGNYKHGDDRTGRIQTVQYQTSVRHDAGNIGHDKNYTLIGGDDTIGLYRDARTGEVITVGYDANAMTGRDITDQYEDVTVLEGLGHIGEHKHIRTVQHDAAEICGGGNIGHNTHSNIMVEYATSGSHKDDVKIGNVCNIQYDKIEMAEGNKDVVVITEHGDVELFKEEASAGQVGAVLCDTIVTSEGGDTEDHKEDIIRIVYNPTLMSGDRIIDEKTIRRGYVKSGHVGDLPAGQIGTVHCSDATSTRLDDVTVASVHGNTAQLRDTTTGQVYTVQHSDTNTTVGDRDSSLRDVTVVRRVSNIGQFTDLTTGQVSTVKHDDTIVTNEEGGTDQHDVTLVRRYDNTVDINEPSTSKGYVSTVHYDVAITNEDGSTTQHNDVTMMISRGNSDRHVDISLNEDSVALSSIIVTTLQRIIDDNVDKEQSTTLTFRE